MKSLLSRLFPYFIIFLLMEALVRLVIGIREWHNLSNGLLSLLASMGLGVVMDTAAFLYILPLLLLIQLCIPGKLHGKTAEHWIQGIFYATFLFVMLFTAVSEWLFWDELTSRFNFIAVDYLIYMDEVVGNIRESYPVASMISCIVVIAVSGGYLTARFLPQHQGYHFTWRQKLGVFLGTVVLAGCSFLTVSDELTDFSENRYNNEIAKDGVFSLFSAFRNNELSYANFYITEGQKTALKDLRDHLRPDSYPFVDKNITRQVTSDKPEIHPNIVLITVESLSAEYMETFGNKDHLTPYLDKLAKESLFFTNLYATGTRTVYGLSAITLSIPPIPGNAIARRPNNGNLFSLGAVLNRKGYDSRFLYGGFGYFDNMNTFFSGNGYRIVDRSQLAENEITFANIWGVCDEDIYQKTLKENDASYAKGQPFFDMIMTTSNHQPFTFPDGKISIESGTGRKGGVRYTDYAIERFIEAAKKRPWFDNTIFVIVADHTAGSSGKLDLTPERHHIPMLFYAPKLIAPATIDTMASQIDLAPTLLGLMNADYESRFYGRDLREAGEARAFIANYQHVGLLKPDALVVLKPIKEASMYRKKNNTFERVKTMDKALLSEAVAYFQNATHWRKLNHDITSHQEIRQVRN